MGWKTGHHYGEVMGVIISGMMLLSVGSRGVGCLCQIFTRTSEDESFLTTYILTTIYRQPREDQGQDLAQEASE